MANMFSRKDFLDALFESYLRDKGGFIFVRTFTRLEPRGSSRFFPGLDILARERFPEEENVFFGVCPREKMKPGAEHIKYICALWAGADVGPDGHSGKERHFTNERQAFVALKSFPLEPSIVVKSGRGRHFYWLLKEPVEIQDRSKFVDLLKRINQYFQCSGGVGLDSALRLPDTWNYKNVTQSFYCSVEHLDSNLRYDMKDFAGLDLRIIIPSKRSPVAPITAPIIPKRRIIIEDDEHPVSVQPPHAGAEPAGETSTYEFEIPPVYSPPIPGDANMEALVDRFLESFTDKHLDLLADKIAQRILAKLGK